MTRRRTFGTVLRRKGKDGKLGRTWYIRYKYRGRVTMRAVGPNKALAEQALAKVELAIAREDWLDIVEVAPLTLAEFLPRLMLTLESRHSDGMVVNERGILTRAAEFFGAKSMKEIEPADVQNFVVAMRQERRLSASATNHYLSTLSVAFKEAIRHKFAKANPVRDVPRPKVPKRAVRYLGEEELAEILNRADDDARPVFRLAFETGLRRGELAALVWSDVDLRRKVLVVRVSKSKQARELPLSGPAVEMLAECLRQRTSILGSEPVLPVFFGKGHKLSRRFRRAADAAGLHEFRLHDLRHGFGSRLAQAGVPIPTIQELMGHSTIHMTMRYAGHMPVDAKRDAIARADAARRAAADASAVGSA